MNRILSLILSLTVNIIAGLLVFAFTQNWVYFVVFSIIIVILLLQYFVFMNYRHIGIISWSKKRGSSYSFRQCIKEVHSSIDFCATWGGSIPSLSPYMERTFNSIIERGCKVRILLLKPGSYGESIRKQRRGSWPAGQPEIDIRWFLNIKKDLGINSGRFRIALYSDIPVWAMVIVDNKKAVVGFYGNAVGRDNPGISLKRLHNKPSFIEPFIMEYNRLWENSEELHTEKDLDRILSNIKKKTGFVFAITGPSCAGKTTLCKKLAAMNYGYGSQTITTRTIRHNEERESKQYEYVSVGKFKELLGAGEILCYTEFCNNYYGVRREMIFDVIDRGDILIMDTIIPPSILKKKLGNRIVILFITPFHVHVLSERLEARKNLSKDEIDVRMKTAKEQLATAHHCDYLLYTDQDIDETNEKVRFIFNKIKQAYIKTHTFYPEEIENFRVSSVVGEKEKLFYE